MATFTDQTIRNTITPPDRSAIALANGTNVNTFMVGELILNDIILIDEPDSMVWEPSSAALVFTDKSQSTISFSNKDLS